MMRLVLFLPLFVAAVLAAYLQTELLWRVFQPDSVAEDRRASVVEPSTYNKDGPTEPFTQSQVNSDNDFVKTKSNKSQSYENRIHRNEMKTKDDIAQKLGIDRIRKNQRYPPSWAKEIATREYPYVAETLYHHGTFPIAKLLLDGTAKPYFPKGVDETSEANLFWPALNESEAVCTLRKNSPGKVLTMPGQFPHNLQQLLKCFTWWQMNPKQQPVLHLEQTFKPEKSKYILEFYTALERVFGVRLDWIERKGNAPGVTVPIGWGQMESLLDAYVMNSKDAKALVNGFLDHYTPNNKHAGCPKKQLEQNQPPLKPVIGFLNREGSRRVVENYKEILSALKGAGYEVRYMPSFDGLSMMDQMSFMSQIDILMGPHGAQFTNTLFQPECGSLFEFFPEHYYGPNFFGSLAALSGKHHFFVYNGGKTTRDAFFEARSTPSFVVNPRVAVEVTHHMVQRWHSCCQLGFRGA